MLSLADGEILVRLARQAIMSVFSKKDISFDSNLDKVGVFVSLHDHRDNSLRGCIGFPEASYPLNIGVAEAAKAAAFGDRRFQPVQEDELNNMIIEISVLTKPMRIYNINEIEIGKDGLVVEYNHSKGLL